MTAPRLPTGFERTDAEILFPDVKTTLNLFGIHMRRVPGNWSYPSHEHPQYEINYLLEGKQTMTVNGNRVAQRSGDLLLLKPGDVHDSRSGDGEPFTYFCIHFDLDDRLFLSLLSRLEQVLFPADGTVARKVAPALGRMMEPGSAFDAGSIAGRMRLQACAFELFAQLWEAISEETASLPMQSYGKVALAHEIARRLQALASQTFHQGQPAESHYGIEEIADELGISGSHASRTFRDVYGKSPRAYWSELVLHEAKQLLADPRHAVQAIAAILGYRDIAHFSRQFKRWTGFAPSDYRRLSGSRSAEQPD
ncbi:AraC family transcriptional regulator [Cohnella nanjingensis]|uniref:AraC family transcriptional regulator n=1 Tax=Cohnella nanjingensis TaxID=1387779 RepID=A0A7X0RPP9_9BACL|nr:AraC family transcriptional regulator [Cohnella nanjingensis]MBB6671388.1 AraC family transcriptional regulator [Cohnella nanjingensis]